MDDSPLDPDVVRRRTLAALDRLPLEDRLEALSALGRGDVVIELCPFTGELTLWIGPVRVVLERSQVTSPGHR